MEPLSATELELVARIAAELRAPKKPKKKPSKQQVEKVVKKIKSKDLEIEIGPSMTKRTKEWGDRKLKETGADFAFNMQSPRVTAFLKDLTNARFGDMNEISQKKVRNAIIRGVDAGEDPGRIAKRIQKIFRSMEDSRAVTIARTEVIRASNFATHEAWEQSGVVKRKRWLSTQDGRTRRSHRAMNGQEKPIKKPFKLKSGKYAGREGMYPGDFKIAAEDIRCRCTITAVMSKRKDAGEVEQLLTWRAYDRAVLPWEREIIAGLRRVFRKQEKAVLQALAQLE